MGVLQRRLASSTYAVLRSFERRIEKLSAVIDDVQAGRITMEQLVMLQRRITEDDDVLETKTADDESTEDGREENEVAEDKLCKASSPPRSPIWLPSGSKSKSCATWPDGSTMRGMNRSSTSCAMSSPIPSSPARSSSSSPSTATRWTSLCAASVAWATPARSP